MNKTIWLLGKEPFHLPTLQKTYFEPAKQAGLASYNWEYDQVYYPKDNYGRPTKTVPSVLQKEWINEKKELLDKADIIICSDPNYFKTLTKQTKTEAVIGQCLESPYLSPKVMYIPSTTVHYFNGQSVEGNITFVMNQCNNYLSGTYSEVGSNIIHSAIYPNNLLDIAAYLDEFSNEPYLFVDIEAFSLKVTKAGIGSICFTKDKHNGIAFAVDLNPHESIAIRALLKDFFIRYQGKLVFHKANYDVTVLIYNLFMGSDLTNKVGLLEGLDTFCPKLEDTLLITYLATNSCAGNVLGLKQLAAKFAGNWAVDVNDITLVPIEDLLKYNLIDGLSTAYVYETYYPLMVQENQENVYRNHFIKYLRDNIHCQLTGLPIDMNEVKMFAYALDQEAGSLINFLNQTVEIEKAEFLLTMEATDKRNAKLKKKQTTPEENQVKFNYSSNVHLAKLVYEVMNLPVIDRTESGEAAAGKDTLEKLKNKTEMVTYKTILEKLIDLADVNKIRSAFIPAFLDADQDSQGNYHLLGYFNLGGTVSGRLSSNNPNMQNLPSTGSRFAKAVKRCFKTDNNHVFVGIDFSSLEDRISALTTKDPNKLALYIDHYDGHCLRAFYYYGSLMPDIQEEYEACTSTEEKVKVINSIANRYPKLRQRGKSPTFACTYAGTYVTLMNNLGFTEEEAKRVEAAYHEMYKVSDEWVADKIREAQCTGFITTAFGLKLRTPILAQTIGDYKKNHKAAAEARTAGNALGQGWGLLNDRAMNTVMETVNNSKFRGMVHPCGKIHDACYYVLDNNAELVSWFNNLVCKEAQWQDNPDIYHPEVGISGNLDIFYPTWADPITLPDNINQVELVNLMNTKVKK